MVVLTLYHGTSPNHAEDLRSGLQFFPRPTDTSVIGPFHLTPSRSAAIEWAVKISNGLFDRGEPGLLCTYNLDLEGLATYDFGVEVSGPKYSEWLKFVRYNWSTAAEQSGRTHPDYEQYDVITCLTSNGNPFNLKLYKRDDGSAMVQVALLTRKALDQCRLVSMEKVHVSDQ